MAPPLPTLGYGNAVTPSMAGPWLVRQVGISLAGGQGRAWEDASYAVTDRQPAAGNVKPGQARCAENRSPMDLPRDGETGGPVGPPAHANFARWPRFRSGTAMARIASKSGGSGYCRLP